MSFLFGHLYDAPCKFTHDQAMFRKKGGDAGVVSGSEHELSGDQSAEKVVSHERGAFTSSPDVPLHDRPNAETSHTRLKNHTELARNHDAAPVSSNPDNITKKRRRSDDPSKSEHAGSTAQTERSAANVSARSSAGLEVTSAAPLSTYEYSEAWKQQAFEAAQGTGPSNWNDITLVSISGHQEREEEL